MLHLVTQSVIQPPKLMICLAVTTKSMSFSSPNTAANQPASGWFLFPTSTPCPKIVFYVTMH
ncbi:hypothetical protein ACOWPH_24880 [Anabaena sp. PCC 7938]|uniref:Uncharacterized protein n=1 Tax=Anabaena cylindrica (strain ATCC 27899 / PCC 7122) TaxID=272123 RepID=K9ZBN0_ANACC|nr:MULTISPECIES: hypothetical protein [Anabaena]AFZ56139.1 hypothetical protein Anacy_0544 [Anabaena cylindrica PCC 7122]MCM2404453.1 hypothetical protein [Anabaena sp. CCAP 1446/1C]BAY01430.1 hypothetical protein NIES19_06620 [Anabaena cylindrica PCC 7122]